MKVAIMQPYIFPYIGYFQLINAVDKFVFYDDVNFIKRGWINRNQILVNNQANLFSIPLIKASQNKLINEVQLAIDEKWLKQFLNTIEFNYKKAPQFEEVNELIKNVFQGNYNSIAELAIKSVQVIANYLQLSTVFEISSEKYIQTKGMEKADRLIEITKLCQADTYINPSGGKELYDKEYFETKNIDLFFIENKIVPYSQFDSNFVGGLSIIDVMMFNTKAQIRNMITKYELV
ncbi:MAG: WbqC family protein [Vicingus serpentipes]|nr:WbqC family protein [Vicingus serpentipes]